MGGGSKMNKHRLKSSKGSFKGGFRGIFKGTLKGRLKENPLKVFLPVVVLGGIFLLLFSWLSKPSAAVWLDDTWPFRVPFTVTNSGLTLTNYQVKLTLDTKTLIRNHKLNSDCSDLRVGGADGTAYSYWVEGSMTANGCNTASTYIWTKIPSLTGSGAVTSVYVYYGNPSASDASSGANTFISFDSFDTLDASKWDTTGSPGVSGGSLSLSNGQGIVTKSTVSASDGSGKIIFSAKQAATTLTGGKVGFSDTNTLATGFHNNNAAALVIGSTQEQVAQTGSTNLVSHHQLEETTSTDANQFKSSGFYDTGKLSQGVTMYGNAAGTTGSTLTFNRGAQISGNNYEHINTNQGTISFWIKPSWAGDDGVLHRLYGSNGGITIYKAVNNKLYAVTNSASVSTTISWAAGTWYHVVARWSVNTIDGTNYIAIRYNNGADGVGATPFTPTAPGTSNIGSNADGSSPAQATIDDFAIYDRPLSTTEIASIYNSGTGATADVVADPSLKFYAKLDGSGTLSPVTYNLGSSASKLTAASGELTGGANLLTDGLMETAGVASWASSGLPTTKEKVSAGAGVGGFDTQVLHLNTPAQTYVQQVLTLDTNSTYRLSFWYKRVSGEVKIFPISATGYASVNCTDDLSTTTWQYNECTFKPSSTTSGVRFSYDADAEYYVDNVSLVPQLADNGGMEGAYSGGLAPGWTAYQGATLAETATAHSGSIAQSIDSSTGSGSRGIKQTITVVSGQHYLVSAWLYRVSGSDFWIELGGAGTASLYGSGSGSWVRVSKVFKASTNSLDLYALGGNSAVVFYVDDVSVVALDSVSASFQSWAPVTDAYNSNANPLSVQGNPLSDPTGVSSDTSGARNNAYKFDGSTGFLRQKTYAVNVGTVTYGTNVLNDSGQTFTSYKSANPATYMVVVTNSDNTVTWGYIGSGGAGTAVNVFTTKAEAVAGWNGTDPTGKTPVGYEIRKTDYQQIGMRNAFTIGAWFKTTASGQIQSIVSRYGQSAWSGPGPLLAVNDTGNLYYHDGGAVNETSSSTVNDGFWHFGVISQSGGQNRQLYLDGKLVVNDTTNWSGSTEYAPIMQVGASINPSSVPMWLFNGSLDSPFVISSALTASQIQDLYNSTASHFGLTSNLTTANTTSAGTSFVSDALWHTYTLANTTAAATLSQDNGSNLTNSTNLPNNAEYLRLQNSDPTNALSVDFVAVAVKAATEPTVSAAGAQSSVKTPVAYWKFDEGLGTSAQDASSQGNAGTITGATWQTPDLCVSGNSCLKFNGTSNYATVNSTVVDTSKPYTYSVWIKPNALTSDHAVLGDWSSDNNGAMIYSSAAGNICSYVSNGRKVCASPALNAWHHLALVDNHTIISFYIDGKLIGTSGSVINDGGTFYIGTYNARAASSFPGFIDEVKIYDYARTADQIKADYNAAGTARGGSVKISNQSVGINSGLVGYWKMDEATWSGTPSEVLDWSGNANHGQAQGATNGKAYPSSAKFSNGGTFDGVDDYVSVGASTSLSFTTAMSASAWVNLSSSKPIAGVVGKWAGNNANRSWVLYTDDARPTFYLGDGTNTFSRQVSTALSLNVWHHVVATYSNTSGMKVFVDGVESTATGGPTYPSSIQALTGNSTYIGVQSSQLNYPFVGKMDELRIYNRALSPSEVSQLYYFTPGRSAYYPLDDKTNPTTDASGNGNSASFVTPVLTAAYPLWSTGKFGSGLSFNGIDNVLTAADSATLDQNGSFSLSSSIRPLSSSNIVPSGTIAAKGNNYRLSLESTGTGTVSAQTRTAFTTSAITTQLSGTAINDVFFYDTTKDTHYGTGNALDPLVWRFDSAKSWYSETKDHTYAACNVTTDDRCGNSEFPEKAYIVSTATKLYIFDAQENAMWMRFDVNYNNYLYSHGTTGNLSSVYMLNGELYAGLNGTDPSLSSANFISDTGHWYFSAASTNVTSNISTRNSTSVTTSSGGSLIVSRIVNDVHAAVIANKTYVAVATDGGVSVINETDGTVVNITVGGGGWTGWQDIGAIFIANNRLYFTVSNATGGASARYAFFIPALSGISTNKTFGGSGADYLSTANSYSLVGSAGITGPQFSNVLKSGAIFATAGTSTVDGSSNTLYLGMTTGGLLIIQEKSGDEGNGSAKLVTKDYITEEMVGDIRGMWSFNGSGSIANAAAVTDKSVKAADLTASNINGTGLTYATGVRGTGITFDGTDDYLKQKVYLTGTQTEVNTTAGSADITLTGLATYKTASQPYAYMIISTNCATPGWGYLGAQISGDQTKIFNSKIGTTQNWVTVPSGGTCDTFEVRKSDFQITGNITVGAWIKTTSSEIKAILAKWDNNAGQAYDLYVSSGKVYIDFRDGSGDYRSIGSTGVVNDNNWHHLIGVKDTSRTYLYIDGILVNSTSAVNGIPDTRESFVVGSQGLATTPGYYFSGTLDEPFVTASALTADEIKRMYEVGKRALTAGGTNTLNGSSNQVNAVVAGGLTKSNSSNSTNLTNSRMYAGTAAGGVSEIDLSSDTLVNSYTNATTPAINSANVTALAMTSGGGFVAGMDSGFSRLNDVSGRSSPSGSSWLSVTGSFDKSTGYYELFENGVSVGKTNVGTAHTPVTNTSLFSLGSSAPSVSLVSSPFYGTIDDVTLTPTAWNTRLTPADVNTGRPATGVSSGQATTLRRPILYLPFDEGSGTTAKNLGAGGPSLNGTLNGPLWSLNGKFGKALQFDGSNDYVNLPASTAFNFGTGDFAVSAWVNTTLQSTKVAVGKNVTGNFWLGIDTGGSGKAEFSIAGAEAIEPTATVADGKWHLMTGVRRNGVASLYVDGKLRATNTMSGDISTTGSPTIGSFGASYYWLGLIDEVKIYSFALTPDEVKQEYNRGAGLAVGSFSDTSGLSGGSVASNSASAIYCVPGDTTSCAAPVAEWNFEEGQGGTVKDSSGNGNDGTWYGGGIHWGPGKQGRGGVFNGGNDYVDISSSNLSSTVTLAGYYTVETWFKTTDTTANQAIFSWGNGSSDRNSITINDNKLKGITYNGTSYTRVRTDNLQNNTWYHGVFVNNGGVLSLYLNGNPQSGSSSGGSIGTDKRIGYTGNSGYFNGSIDQVRIFNYARTPAQIAWDFNRGAPVAHYMMDECAGTAIHDLSGNGNDGILNLGASGVTSAGTCSDGTGTTAWNKGKNGKYNSSMNFDGQSDYVDIGDNTSIKFGAGNSLSVSYWIKASSLTGSGTMIHKGAACDTNADYYSYLQNATLNFSIGSAGSGGKVTATLPNTNWHLVTGTYTSSSATNGTVSIYLDGVLKSTSNATAKGASSADNLHLGNCRTGEFFSGLLDDVRVYNYALTAKQVQLLFNQNGALRNGPNSGNP